MAEVPHRRVGVSSQQTQPAGARGERGPRGPQGSESAQNQPQPENKHGNKDQPQSQAQAPDRSAAQAGGGPAAGGEAMDDRLRRALADLDNLRKRFDREMIRQRAAERALVLEPWLAVVDNLERALAHADTDSATLAEGLRAVLDQALAALAQLGFSRFDDVGQPFDPLRHEAVAAVETDTPPGTIVDVVRPGYGTPEVVLRPAAVVVARRPD